MKLDKRRFLAGKKTFPLWLAVAAALACAADNEDFNWTEGSKFVERFPYPQQFIDSLTASFGVSTPAQPLRDIPPHLFAQNEMLVYDVGWSIFKGGYVILTATPDTAARVIRLGAKALSRGFVSTFYRMRDYIISTVDARGLYPLFFEEHLREGKHYKSDRWVLYDHAKGVLYAKGRPVTAPSFTNDYISMLYLARTRRFAPGDTFSLPFFVDGKLYRLFFSCSGRETLDFCGGKVACLVTQPLPIDEKGVANRKKGLEVWFSDDAAKLPLKIKAKITIGSITANLIYVSRRMSRRPPVPQAIDTAKRVDPQANRDTIKTPDTGVKLDTLKKTDTGLKHDTLSKPDTSVNRDTVKKADTGLKRDSLRKADTGVNLGSGAKPDTDGSRTTEKKDGSARLPDTIRKK